MGGEDVQCCGGASLVVRILNLLSYRIGSLGKFALSSITTEKCKDISGELQ